MAGGGVLAVEGERRCKIVFIVFDFVLFCLEQIE